MFAHVLLTVCQCRAVTVSASLPFLWRSGLTILPFPPRRPQQRKTEAQSLRPVTIKQLVDQVKNADDDCLAVDGAPLSNITVLGKIVSVQDKSTQVRCLCANTGFSSVHVVDQVPSRLGCISGW